MADARAEMKSLQIMEFAHVAISFNRNFYLQILRILAVRQKGVAGTTPWW